MLDAAMPRTASDRHHLAMAHELKGDRCLPSVPAQLFLRQHLEQRVLRMLRRHGLWQRLPALRLRQRPMARRPLDLGRAARAAGRHRPAHLLRATTLLNTHHPAVLTAPKRVAAPRRPVSAPARRRRCCKPSPDPAASDLPRWWAG